MCSDQRETAILTRPGVHSSGDVGRHFFGRSGEAAVQQDAPRRAPDRIVIVHLERDVDRLARQIGQQAVGRRSQNQIVPGDREVHRVDLHPPVVDEADASDRGGAQQVVGLLFIEFSDHAHSFPLAPGYPGRHDPSRESATGGTAPPPPGGREASDPPRPAGYPSDAACTRLAGRRRDGGRGQRSSDD